MTQTRAQRLRAVADAYLGPRQVVARSVVVAASPNSPTAGSVARRLFSAAERLGCATELLMSDDSMQRSVPDSETALRIVDFGELDAASVRRLAAPPPGQGPDLFLYCLPDRVPQPLRELYTLSLWSWALGARWTRCLVPGAGPSALRQLRAQWQRTAELPRAELLPWPEVEPESQRLCLQILQSVLAAGSRARGD